MKAISSFTVSALLAFAAWPAHAQDEPATPPSAPTAEAPTAAPVALPDTAPVTRAELEAVKSEVKQLRAEAAQRELDQTLAHEREATEAERHVRIYGFADFGLQRSLERDDSVMQENFPRPLSFYLGRLNLYFDAKPDPDFRFLVETRLSLYPSGSAAATYSSTGQVQRTSTLVTDRSSANPWAYVNWGSIILERAVLDWTRFPLFSLRAGVFLTPFGIYNVDHGSPTIISTALPTYVTLGWFPVRQIGLQLFGSYPIDRWEVGYAATVANGQTDDGVRDVGDSKAFGGRLYVRRMGELRLLLGASGLYRPFRRDTSGFVFDPASPQPTFQITRTVESKQLTLGLDQSIDFAGLRIRNELVFYQAEYTPGKRDNFLGVGFMPDNRQFNWSFLAAYRYWQIEPYFFLDYFHSSPATQWHYVWQPGAGFNVYLSPSVMVKTSWLYVRFYREDDPDKLAARMNVQIFNGMLVWAF